MSLNSFRSGLENTSRNPVVKWALFGIGALLVFSLVFSGLGNNLGPTGAAGRGGAAAPAGGDIVATVNGDPITRQEYESALDQTRSRMGDQAGGLTAAPFLNGLALDQSVNSKLQLQMAKSIGLTASDAEIQKARASIVDQAQLRQKLSLPAGASVSDIDTALANAGHQSLEETFPDAEIRQGILIGGLLPGTLGKLQQTLLARENVTADEARASFVQYHTRHILVDNKTRPDVQAKARAMQILAKAKAPGANFAALAKQFSDDPGTKSKGGDDSFIDETTPYDAAFKKAAFSLKPGEVTPDPVLSPQFGYFIIKLDGTKSNVPADFDKNPAKYVDQVKQQRAGEKYQTAMQSLKQSAKIDVKDPALAGDRALSSGKFPEAVADYNTALKGATGTQAAEINAALGQAYLSLHQTPQALTAYEAALKSRPDATLEETTGKLYLQSKDTAHAVPHFQQASTLGWNDQSLHIQLQQDFTQAGRPDLARTEADWLKKYAQAHPPAPSGAGGLPPGLSLPGASGAPGQPIIVNGGGGGKPQPAVRVTPAPAHAPKPTQ